MPTSGRERDTAQPPTPEVRSAGLFRAIVLAAVAAGGGVATGCPEMVEAYGVPPVDVVETSDDAAGEDAAEGTDVWEALPPYGLPDGGP